MNYYWLIHYDDAEKPDEVFRYGDNAEHAAKERYKIAQQNWVCTLFCEAHRIEELESRLFGYEKALDVYIDRGISVTTDELRALREGEK